MREEEIYRKALEKWGVPHQMMVLCEEYGELIQAISKALRWGEEHPGHALPERMKDDIAHETADCYLMLGQMTTAFGISESELEHWHNAQISKLKGYLYKEDAR